MKKIRPKEVRVDEPRLSKLLEIFANTSNRTLANYLFYRVAHESAPYLNAEIRNTHRNAMELLSPPDDFLVNSDRCTWCINEVFKYFPTQTNAIYARKYFPKNLKEKVNNVIERVSDAISERFKTSEYLDEYTKINALKKLNSTERSMGINNEWFEEYITDQMCKKYKFNLDNLLSNKLQAQQHFDQLEDVSDAQTFAEVNAYNLQNSNKIGKLSHIFGSPYKYHH